MKKIYKYPLSPESITMPIGAQVLTVQMQNHEPYIWAIVNPEKENEERLFIVYGTGHPIEDDCSVQLEYIGTFQHGTYVWHLFEDTRYPHRMRKETSI